jgi:hypothetical protein
VIVSAATKAEIWNALDLDLTVHSTVIMGYVEPVRAGSSDWSSWEGSGTFQVSHHGNGGVSLLGCKHSYWGDIAGVLLWKLSRLGVRKLLYVGKLGSLRDDLMPNETLVTGATSLIGGAVVDWSGSDLGRELTDVQRVRHVHLPSTMLETRAWAVKARTVADVVDPEIGHLGRSALTCGVSFGYLHLVTDNLLEVTGVGLHNERAADVRTKREVLMKRAVESIYRLNIW